MSMEVFQMQEKKNTAKVLRRLRSVSVHKILAVFSEKKLQIIRSDYSWVLRS